MSEYIEREAMVKASCERCNGEYVPCDKEHCLLMEVIHSLPAADVRPVVRGRLELLQVADEAGDKWNRWFCSECGHVAAVGWEHTRDGAKPKYNFCPNCGAEMEEC